MSRRRVFESAGAFIGAALLGAAIAAAGIWPAALVLGAGAVAVLSLKPELGFYVIVASVSSAVAVYAWPKIGVAGIGLYVSEVLLLAGVAACVPAYIRGFKSGLLSIDWLTVVVAGLLATGLAGVVVGILKGASPTVAINEFRPLLYLTAFIPARVAVMGDRGVERSLGVLVLGGLLVSLLALLQALIGPGTQLFIIGTFDALLREDPATGFFRVRPPGLYLIYATTAWSLVSLLWGGTGLVRRLAPFALPLGAVAIGLSFNRNMLVGLSVGLIVAVVVARRRSRATLAVALAGSLLTALLVTVGTMNVDSRLVGRFTSLLSGDARSSALSDRAYETGWALQAVAREPVMGIGWGRGYGALATRAVGGQVTTFERPWLHNQYLNLWMRTGMLGGVLMVTFAVGLVVSCVRSVRVSDAADEWIPLALVTSAVAFGASAIVDIVVANPSNLVVWVFMAACASSLLRARPEGEVARP